MEYQIILKAVHTFSDQCKVILKDVKKVTEKSNSSLKDILADISTIRREINQRLDELEGQTTKDVINAKEQDNNRNLKTVETTCEGVTKSLKTLSDTIVQLNTAKQADELFIEQKLALKTIKDVEENTLQLTSYDIKGQIFIPNEAISTLLKTEKSFGELTRNSLSKASASQHVQANSIIALHQGEVCVKTSKDKDTCWITGMTFLTPDLLIIADRRNSVIKMVNVSGESVTDQLPLPGEPWDITKVISTELAVTLPDKKTIQFILVSLNKLTKKRTLKVDGKCNGISYHRGKLVVLFCDPSKSQVIDMNGNVQRDIDGKSIFKLPLHVTSNSSSIYVSDCGMNTVTRLNGQGEVTGSYRSNGGFDGIEMSDECTVFACNKKRNVIEEISGDCSTGRVVLKNLTNPEAICWCADTKILIFSSVAEKKKNLTTSFRSTNCLRQENPVAL